MGRKEKGHLLNNIYFGTPALKASSESSLLPGVCGRIPESHVPMSRLKILEKRSPSWTSMKDNTPGRVQAQSKL